MNNWTKYMVHVHHTKNYAVNEKYCPFETRAVRIYDSVDDGLNGLLELVKCEPDFSNSDLLLFNADRRQEIKDEIERYGDYSISFECMHDMAKGYIGPGAYSLDKVVLS